MNIAREQILRHSPDDSLTKDRSEGQDGNKTAQKQFLLAGWRVEASQNRLTKGHREIILEPKAMDVLVQLAAAGGESVSREDLLKFVWPDVFVADDSLHSAVSRLRRAISMEPALSNAVITVPKRGYRIDPDLLAVAPERDMPKVEPAAPETGMRDANWKHLGIGVAACGALLAALFVLVPRQTTSDYSNLRTTPLTGYVGQERAAAFSPDGEKVVFAWSGEAGNDWDLYVIQIGEWSPQRLTNQSGGEFSPAWSPDNESIAFVRLDREHGCRIMIITPDGDNEMPLRSCSAGGDVDLAWAPDSRTLFFTDRVGRNGPISVHTLDTDSGAEHQISYPPSDHWGDALVRVAPAGDKIAFARTRALGVTDIYVASLDGDILRQITDDRLKIHGLDWSAQGDRLFFSSNRGGTFGLWTVMSSGGGKPQPVTAGVNTDSVAVSRNGTRLVFENETTITSLNRVSLSTEGPVTPRKLTQAAGWDWHPTISPDGTKIAYISDRAGSPELWVSALDGSDPQKLTKFGGAYANSPAWAPDGKSLLVTAPVSGNFDLYSVHADTGEIERLTDHPSTDRNPSWSRDGSYIYFGSNRTGDWEIWRLTRSNNNMVQITTNGGFRAQQTENGVLLYVKREQPGLFAITANDTDAQERLINDRLLPLDWANWQTVGSDVYFISRGDNGDVGIVRLDIESAAVISQRTLDSFSHHSGLAITPDGGAAIYALPDVIESDLMLMEGFDG